MAKMYGKGKTAIESEEQQKLRWQVELEFVQCLANPNYLNFLAQRGYFKDQAFINYLKYLQYWKEPEYAKYLMYPMCLYFLDLLQYEHFRREIVNSQCCKFIDDQAILQWQHYTRKRIKMVNGDTTALTGASNKENNGDVQQTQQITISGQSSQQQSQNAAGTNVQVGSGSGGGGNVLQNGTVGGVGAIGQSNQLISTPQQQLNGNGNMSAIASAQGNIANATLMQKMQ